MGKPVICSIFHLAFCSCQTAFKTISSALNQSEGHQKYCFSVRAMQLLPYLILSDFRCHCIFTIVQDGAVNIMVCAVPKHRAPTQVETWWVTARLSLSSARSPPPFWFQPWFFVWFSDKLTFVEWFRKGGLSKPERKKFVKCIFSRFSNRFLLNRQVLCQCCWWSVTALTIRNVQNI